MLTTSISALWHVFARRHLDGFLDHRQRVLKAKGDSPLESAPGLTPADAWPDDPSADLLAFRQAKGSLYSNFIQSRAQASEEERSRLRLQQRDLESQLQELESNFNAFLQRSPAVNNTALIWHTTVLLAMSVAEASYLSQMAHDYMPSARATYANTAACWLVGWGLFSVLHSLALQTFEADPLSRKQIASAVSLLLLGLVLGALRSTSSSLSDSIRVMVFVSTVAISIPVWTASLYRKICGLSAARATERRTRQNFETLRRGLQEKRADVARRTAQSEAEFEANLTLVTRFFEQTRRDADLRREAAERFTRVVAADQAQAAIWFNFWSRVGDLFQSRVSAVVFPAGIAFAILMGLLLSGCGPGKVRPPNHAVVVVDRSSSGSGRSGTHANLLPAAQFWAESALERGGGSFSVWVVGTAYDDASEIFRATVPRRFEAPASANQKRWLAGFVDQVSQLQLPDRPKASAIAQAVLRVSASLTGGAEGDKTLILLSDLRQVAPPYNFEKEVPEPEEFLAWLNAQGKPTALAGGRIIACGFHGGAARGTSPIDFAQHTRLRAVWERAFVEWGIAKHQITEQCDFQNP